MDNDKELTHIDLFSGIGGFTLAAEWAGFKTIVFCEKEEFCQKVLQKRFGAVVTDSDGTRTREQGENIRLQKDKKEIGKERFRDVSEPENRIPLIPEIRDFDGTKWQGATLLTGGFPCQPFSHAGKRKGKEDDRYLWPEMLRVISEAKPRWILAENVPGIFHMALDTVLTDLEREGYTTGTFIIPACSLNAPHRRNRVWIIAHSSDNEHRGWSRPIRNSKEIQGEHRATLCGRRTSRASKDAPDSASKRKESISQQRQGNGIKPANRHASDSNNFRIRCNKRGQGETESTRSSWDEDWYEIATRFCRVDDGVPDRIHRLKALGNAIVPQIAYEILKNIAWIEKEL